MGIMVEASPESLGTLGRRAREAVQAVQDRLFREQQADGHWVYELVVDTTVVSDWVLYWHWAGRPEVAQEERCARHLLERQLEDGGWPQFPGGPSEVNATVKAYHALRLCGWEPDRPELERARACALRLGGVPAMHTFGKLYLAILGLFPWRYLPTIAVEMMLAPRWFPFTIYAMSSWTRNLVVPLAVINACKPTRVLARCPSLDELYPGGSSKGVWRLPRGEKFFSWRNAFLVLNEMAKVLNHLPVSWLRNRSLRRAEAWILERLQDAPPGEGCSDGMGAIFPGMLNTLIALECLAYPTDHPVFARQERDFRNLLVDDPEDLRVAPCVSPVWDTAIIAQCLGESGIGGDDPRLQRAADWLLGREIRIRGDWKENNPYPHAGGFAFEYNNDYYPDVDDTFQVILGLYHLKSSRDEQRLSCLIRSLDWCRSFQCREGGFAAFDKDLTQAWLEQIPFADHNAILDPPCSDITGRALETMALLGVPRHDPVVLAARRFVLETQHPDGSWFGRWGVNHLYGTSHAIRGLAAIGEDLGQPRLLAARSWLEAHQNTDGGWGESCWSYHQPDTRGQGPSTASQTAWALLGLLCWGDPQRPSVRRGVQWLVDHQEAGGGWAEVPYTGTGFPRIFYLKYTSYALNWPLLALSRWLKAGAGSPPDGLPHA